MSLEPLDVLHQHAPLPDHAIGVATYAAWDDGLVAAVVDAGFLRAIAPADHLVCTACEEQHTAAVIPPAEPGDAFGYVCEVTGALVSVPPEDLRQFQIDHAAWARAVGSGLGARHDPDEPTVGRIWRWERVAIAERLRTVVLVRGLSWSGGAALWPSCGLQPTSVVLGLGITKPRPPADLPPDLRRVFTAPVWSYVDLLASGEVTIDTEALEQDLWESQEERPARKRAPTTRETARRTALQAIVAELKRQLAAAQDAQRQKRHGEADRILAALTQETVGRLVNLSKFSVTRYLQDGSGEAARAKRLFEIIRSPETLREVDLASV